MNNESLENVQKAAAAGQLAIVRHGGEFSISLPLSPNDRREAKATVDACKNALDKRLPGLEPLVMVAQLTHSIEAEDDGDKGLIVRFKLPPLVSLTPDSTYPNAKPDPKLADRYRNVIDFVRRQKMPIDDKLTVKEVVDGLAVKPR